MASDPSNTFDETTTSFLTFARGLLLKLEQLEQEFGPPRYDDLEVTFVEHGRRSSIVNKLDYERFFRRHWAVSFADVKDLARDCVRLHLDRGLLKAPPPPAAPQGLPAAVTSFEEILPSLVFVLSRPVLMTIDKLQTLQVPDAEFIATYQRFVEGWCMEDVPQLATVPLLNFGAETDLKITPFFELVSFTPADKNLLFSRTAGFDDHRERDHHATFKLAGQFSNGTKKSATFGTIANETWLAITAMRLLKSGDVGARMIYHRSSLEHEQFTGGSGQHFQVRDFSTDVYSLKESEGPLLLSLIALLRAGQTSGALRSLNVGLRRFNQSYSRQSGEDRIIDLTISLESSLLADINEELKHRLALRGAALLRRERKPQEVHALLLALYNARSAIVHEGKVLWELDKQLKLLRTHFNGFQPQNLPTLCEELTRNVLKAYLAELVSGTTMRSLNTQLDSDLVENMTSQQE